MDSDNQNVQVFVRSKPLPTNETSICIFPENGEVWFHNRQFNFKRVFGPETDQRQIYFDVVHPLIKQVLAGFSCTILAYGPTGSGKTYTMEGDCNSPDNVGIIPRAVTQILETLKPINREFKIHASMLELYNEEVYDLLKHEETKLKIYDNINVKNSVVVENLEQVLIESEADIYTVLNHGSSRRRTASTICNNRSSRSHTVFTVTVIMKEGETEVTGKLNLVDLAGSENIAKSGALDSRAREAKNINKSLLTLGRVITALVEKQAHIPYRESKLTRLLQDSLGGKTKTSIIATISASLDSDETLSTLEYANRAQNIANKPERNRNFRKRTTDHEVEELLEKLKEKHSSEISEMEFKIRNEVAQEFRLATEKIKERYDIDYANLKDYYEGELQKATDIKEQLSNENKQIRNQVQQLERDLMISKEHARYLTQDLPREFEEKYLEAEIKIKTLNVEIKNLKMELQDKQSETIAANKVRKAPPIDTNDYANMTFDDADELTQVTDKKTKAQVKRKRVIKPSVMLSGKKKKLTNNAPDSDLSPILKEGRMTRSRATTRRKLDY